MELYRPFTPFDTHAKACNNTPGTINVFLGSGEDFEGGDLITVEPDGALATHPLRAGDAALFVSHKYHNVTPVTKGKRQVLVAEVWQGAERECAHRCLRAAGECDYTLTRAQMARVAQDVAMLG